MGIFSNESQINTGKRKRKLEEDRTDSDGTKRKLTDREQQEKIKLDEAQLGSTSGKYVFLILFWAFH